MLGKDDGDAARRRRAHLSYISRCEHRERLVWRLTSGDPGGVTSGDPGGVTSGDPGGVRLPPRDRKVRLWEPATETAGAFQNARD